jgi:hypothetical protein
MKNIFLFPILILSFNVFSQNNIITSPNKKLSAKVWVENNHAFYSVSINNQPLLLPSNLGLIREDADFTMLSLRSVSPATIITDKYESINAKRRINIYKATKRIFHFKNNNGNDLDIVFQVSDDGVAFRYFFPGKSNEIKKIKEEITSFHFSADTKAWLQPMAESKSGWEKTNPSYEEYYQKEIDAGTPSPTSAGWVYPALFRSGNTWALITEGSLDGKYCGSRLKQYSPDKEYTVGFPPATEGYPEGAVNPESMLPWYSPWRIIAVGSLKTIVESTLGTDLAVPAIKMDASFIRPGKASWSWVLLKDDSTVYDVQKRFIDYAADMHWQYCLVDADWDRKIGYEKIKELADYAKTKNVGLLLWYNSAGNWNTVKYTPKDKLLTHDDRVKEFTRLHDMGIKGIKVDFFGGDGQSMIQYYIDIFKDAAAHQLLVNCHGATIPRGWQRTYPNLMTMESIKGMEFITFEQKNADEEPFHATTIPFTRNVFDPMDFTPMCLYKIPNKNRRTSSAFELALPILFLSGIQHLAETPVGMTHVPGYVKEFLQNIPDHWDDTKFIDGYPGKFAIITRRSNNQWFIAGINGEKMDKEVSLDLSFLPANSKGFIISDGADNLSFSKKDVVVPQNKKLAFTIKANGGFVIKLQ